MAKQRGKGSAQPLRLDGIHARAAAAEAARLRLKTPHREVGAAAAFHQALAAVYPPGFRENCRRLQAGDASAAEQAIAFIEADPWFFRSGYVKARLAIALKRIPLAKDEKRRLQAALLRIVDTRYGREFREFCHLAREIATPDFPESLIGRVDSDDIHIRRRAAWMLAAVASGPHGAKPARSPANLPQSRFAAIVTNHADALQFYRSVLGLEIEADITTGDERWVVIGRPGTCTHVRLVYARSMTQMSAASAVVSSNRSITMCSADFDRDCAALAAVGIEVRRSRYSSNYGHFLDICGNRWSLSGCRRAAAC